MLCSGPSTIRQWRRNRSSPWLADRSLALTRCTLTWRSSRFVQGDDADAPGQALNEDTRCTSEIRMLCCHVTGRLRLRCLIKCRGALIPASCWKARREKKKKKKKKKGGGPLFRDVIFSRRGDRRQWLPENRARPLTQSRSSRRSERAGGSRGRRSACRRVAACRRYVWCVGVVGVSVKIVSAKVHRRVGVSAGRRVAR